MIALTFFLVETFDTPRCIKQRFLTLFQLVDIILDGIVILKSLILVNKCIYLKQGG